MDFDLSIRIEREREDVFAFLRDKDKCPQEEGSPVLVLDQVTPGPPGIGTRYREVVQMLPFAKGEIWSTITRYDPPEFLEEDFHGAGMFGHLAYEFQADGRGTILHQRETLMYNGVLRLFEPVIRMALSRQLRKRLEEIKRVLESGWAAPPDTM